MTTSSARMAAAQLSAARQAWAANATLRLSNDAARTIGVDAPEGFRDVRAHFEGLVDHLAQALAVQRAELFAEQVGWLRSVFVARGLPDSFVAHSLVALREEIESAMQPPAAAAAALAALDVGAMRAATPAPSIESAIESSDRFVDVARRYLLALLENRRDDALALVLDAIDAGASVTDVHQHVLARAQRELGVMWQRGEIHVAEEHVGSRITEHVVACVHARHPSPTRGGPRVLLTSPSGDLHEVGLRMLAHQFELAGCSVVLAGASTPAEDVARAARDFDVDFVAVSAHLALHVTPARTIVERVHAASNGRRIPVVVGGGPFERVPDLWSAIGADACASTVGDAIERARRVSTR